MAMGRWKETGPINGARLRLLRYLVGCTLHELAEKSKVSAISIWSFESGCRPLAADRSVNRLATAVNIAPTFLRGEDNIPVQLQTQLDLLPTEVLLAEVTRRFPQMGDRTLQMKARIREARAQ